ncbi:outer membrane protein [Rhodopseudomonas palustris]|uniref:outer membrane protein n=1 Tax=Rhodopseudomonas palustris TaxID=1076 RepID=UPI002ACD8146|nr:outer membrane protein [Rhodopseudomonas palustris]WQG99450.1 outer membrane protein [Rhodopseudomonas palustris]
MRKLAMAAATVLAATGSTAQAADMGYYRSQTPYTVNQPLNAFSWAGPYLGGNLGYAFGNVTNNITNPSGFSGGVQGGYNWQSGNIVFGLEGDIQFSTAEDTFAPYKFSNPWFGTARGRVGYAMNDILLYATGGLAFGQLKGQNLLSSESHSSAGWTVGAGAEFAFAPKLSAKVEYLYGSLSTNNFFITGNPNGYNFGLVRAGINYHF